jgi:hypothetical protein
VSGDAFDAAGVMDDPAGCGTEERPSDSYGTKPRRPFDRMPGTFRDHREARVKNGRDHA